ncbi:hypothetical protein F2Q70_00029195 [Brassica cretica]|uniref:Uncharacterized protein n=1 Tax=Brassica cretica TaxID=69181 RepID=A0A8S9FGJ7_BRACR|nr:hypothetical protein F2Q70_00029195 [Brassica cretica]
MEMPELPRRIYTLGEECSIPIPRSELDQSKVGLIRRDRHVGHVIGIGGYLKRLLSNSGTFARAVSIAVGNSLKNTERDERDQSGSERRRELAGGPIRISVTDRREKSGGRGELNRCNRCGQRKRAGWPIRVCDGGRESFCPTARSSGQFESEKSAVILDGGPNAGRGSKYGLGLWLTGRGACVPLDGAQSRRYGLAVTDVHTSLTRMESGSDGYWTEESEYEGYWTDDQWAGSVCMLEKAEGWLLSRAYVQGTGSGALSMDSVLSVLDGWLETKPSLFVYLGHVGMHGDIKDGTWRDHESNKHQGSKDRTGGKETGSGPHKEPPAVHRISYHTWGRVAFKVLMDSVKGRDISGCYTINGFAQALQVWVYTTLPELGATFGNPLPNNPSPPILVYKGRKGR